MRNLHFIFLLLSLLITKTAICDDIPHIVKPASLKKMPIEPKILNLVKVPNLVGLPVAQARLILEQNGLEEDEKRPSTDSTACEKAGKGNIAVQDPIADSMVAAHSKVRLSWCD